MSDSTDTTDPSPAPTVAAWTSPARHPQPTTRTAIATVWRLTLGAQATKGRIVGLLALGLVGMVVGLAIGVRAPIDVLSRGTHFIDGYGLTLYAPIVCLVFGSAAFGDPTEDGSLVHLWLRPVPRWQLVVGAWLATITVCLPVVVIPLTIAAALTGAGSLLIAGAFNSALLAVIVYSAVFVCLGVVVRRALVWGMVYILLWEGFVASAGRNAARGALRAYTRSVLSDATGVDLKLAVASKGAAIAVPIIVAIVALAFATRRLIRSEVA